MSSAGTCTRVPLHLIAAALALAASPFAPVASLHAQDAPAAAADAAAQVVQLGTLHGQMKYDVEFFQVKPGATVKLVFKNTDEMQHNVVICKPGEEVWLQVAQKAWALGADAVKKEFVPDDGNVLFHTKVVDPQASDTITFKAPKEEGDYPYVCTLPGHAYLMRGVMRVGASATGLSDLTYAYYEGIWSKLPDFSTLTPKRTGKLPKNVIDLTVAEREDHFGLVFTGKLNAPHDGEYTFYVNSDDGSRIVVNDQAVVVYDGIHAPQGDRTGKIRLAKGAHAFRVEFFEGQHGQQLDVAWEGPTITRALLSPRTAGETTTDDRHRLQVTDRPLVIRAFVDGGPARAISVGLPSGTHYCLDAETGSVAFGWKGGFLDVAPDRGKDAGARGGGWCKILGERFTVGTIGFPLRFDDPAKEPVVKFGGYRRPKTSPAAANSHAGGTGHHHHAPVADDLPVFLFSMDGIPVQQRIRPAPQGTGLQYEYQVGKVPGDLYFVVDPAGLELTASAGTWTNGVLKIPPADARQFTVTLTRR